MLASAQQLPVYDDSSIQFDVFKKSVVTRAGTAGDITYDNLTNIESQHGKDGFGVFAFYDSNKTFDSSSSPNFMYNQQVKWDGSRWIYEPVKYWPNVFDNEDYVTFFAYAPWTRFIPTSGKPDIDNYNIDIDNFQNKNIIGVTNNSAQGAPFIKYRVDVNPATSVDLQWGVVADESNYIPSVANNNIQNKVGLPFVNMIKPASNQPSNITFNLLHALAKVKITIDFVPDPDTPFDADKTRIYVRWLNMSGFAMEGALNLNNTIANTPLWKDIDGTSKLDFSEAVVFQDGRKDGKEGTQNGSENELNMYLNPAIIENYASTEIGNNSSIIFGSGKTPGVTATSVPLFNGANGYFYIIPRNSNKGVNILANYVVETIDESRPYILSDGVTYGSVIENQMYKEDIFGSIDFEAGKQYEIKIHLGMTSMKVESTVSDWDETNSSIDDDPYKCATPTIHFNNGKLTFDCTTEGVSYSYDITDSDIKSGIGSELDLSATYNISVVAKKTGLQNSDVATATLVWSNASFTETTPATAIAPAAEMEASVPVLIQNNGGTLTIQGAQDGTPISVYTIAGMQAGTAVSQNSMARISTSMQQGAIAIVRIGNRSVKVVIK